MKISNEYLAGLLDGEAYFGLIPRRGMENGYERKGYYPAVKMAFKNQDAEILLELHKLHGGFIHQRKAYGTTQPSTQWEVKGKKALKDFLPKVIPYMILKKRQAELLQEFCEMPYNYRRKLDQTNWNRTLVIFEELRELKCKSPATTE
jgi:hypothetical protein